MLCIASVVQACLLESAVYLCLLLIKFIHPKKKKGGTSVLTRFNHVQEAYGCGCKRIEGIKCNVGQGGEKRFDCLGSNGGYGFIYS